MRKILEYNLREYLKNELGFEERRKMINSFPKDLRGDIAQWLFGKKLKGVI
jgi:uncharacterized protein YeeX (DUF496 family)